MPIKQRLFLYLLLFFLLGLMAYLFIQQRKGVQSQQAFQAEILQQHAELQEVTRKAGQVALMGHLLDGIEEKLEKSSSRSLDKRSIARISNLSKSFERESLSYLQADSLGQGKYSRERGQLLRLLILMDMDSLSFAAIMRTTTFAWADLRSIQLDGVSLVGADLQGANLQEAQLENANLSQADLKGANLWGAKLRGVNLYQAQLHRADLSWADLSEANMSQAVFKGAKLIAAQLRNTDLRGAIGYYSFADGAFFNGADLTGANIFGTDLIRANFQNTVLKQVDLRETNMSEALLYKTDMTEALLRDVRIVEPDWLKKLSGWKVKGATGALEKYEVLIDQTKRAKYVVKIRAQ